MLDTPVFTRHADGSVTVDRWTSAITIARELLRDADDLFLRQEGALVTFNVANGCATYRITQEREREVDAVLERGTCRG